MLRNLEIVELSIKLNLNPELFFIIWSVCLVMYVKLLKIAIYELLKAAVWC